MIASLTHASLVKADGLPNIIPAPMSIEGGEGSFAFGDLTRIAIPAGNEALRPIAQMLQMVLRDELGRAAVIEDTEATIPAGVVVLAAPTAVQPDDTDSQAGQDAYDLHVTGERIWIRASGAAGYFYAVQTLMQLTDDAGVVPAVRIIDRPRYAWRGFMLDCSRHFMDKDTVKRLIDRMASLKLNRFHWHLTDTNGWRLPIEGYPELTRIGAAREYGEHDRPPLFYTRADVQEILDHARARHVKVIPEIEMPGHCAAAILAYPQIGCPGGKGARFAMCAGQEKTFEFIFAVLDDVVRQFPQDVSPLIHIGGDERPDNVWNQCPHCTARMAELGLTTEHDLQTWFMRRVTEYMMTRHGRRAMSWAAVVGDVWHPTNMADIGHVAVVQNWHGGAGFAARNGFDVVNSDVRAVYFDYPQFPGEPKPFDWMGYTTLEEVYAFDPTPAGLTGQQQRRIMGVEACLWTEAVPQAKADWMTFPRILALAEIAWSPAERKDFADFERRVEVIRARHERQGVEYASEPERDEPVATPAK